ncbi:hypothetical protein LOTGIDRAFT_169835 [Lottia gigantea]|uniref:MANSC domain-containing protein n=1 Tax=Lottia gigantea TaxID=225164 RepID=V4B3P8_LOTGI|nr:hypothetical protein LOTGIDRAFT_169835 [Lottia gigantea]ESO83004.1 hypothetical protein LOTGIDRAFT_169835 [Lottia gigantea]
MKTLLVACLVLTVTVFGKESVSDIFSLLEDPDVLQEIVKRLGHSDPVKESDTDSSIDDSCQHKNFSNTIIQTKASTAAGAAFLDSVNGLVSNYDCIKRCCELDGCELAVYENKNLKPDSPFIKDYKNPRKWELLSFMYQGDRNCYLFRCKDPDSNKNYCEFASLDGYISSSITHDVKAEKIFQTSSNSDHENDLQDLSESGKLVNDPVSTTTTTTEKPEEPHSVVFLQLYWYPKEFSILLNSTEFSNPINALKMRIFQSY